MARRSIPRRITARARRTAKLAGSVAAAGARRLIRKSEDDDRVFGEALASELDTMKGMAMKVGQILSYMDGALPAESQAMMRTLQRGAEPLALDVIQAVVDDALELPLQALFDRFDPEPVAAASIGQVHRASVTGTEVAVKVQYPHVRETFDLDMRQLRRLARVASAATRVDGVAIVDDIQARLHEECDYTFEARWLERFRAVFADDPQIVFPAVVPDRSTETVLTTTWCEGRDFYSFCDQASEDERQAAARTMIRFAMTSLYAHGAINADPHPGNVLFRDRGEVVFLDFGCVRVLPTDWLDRDRAVVRALLADDRAAFDRAVLDSGIIAGDPARFDLDTHHAMMRWQWAPFLTDSFTFTPEHMQEGTRFSGPTNPNLRRMAIDGPWVWVERLRWGLLAVLTRMGASGSFRPILEQALDRPHEPFVLDGEAA